MGNGYLVFQAFILIPSEESSPRGIPEFTIKFPPSLGRSFHFSVSPLVLDCMTPTNSSVRILVLVCLCCTIILNSLLYIVVLMSSTCTRTLRTWYS